MLDVERVIEGQDAVVVTLGISEDAMRVRLFGSKATPLKVRSLGTANVIAAMLKHGVRRLVVQTLYGVGPTRSLLPLNYRILFKLILAPQIADSEAQERFVRQSGLDWVLVQPVSLTDEAIETQPFVSTSGETNGMHVSRAEVGRVLARAVTDEGVIGKTLSVSGGVAEPEPVAVGSHERRVLS